MASREEKELQDVERCMEEELVAEHMQVERVIHLRGEEVKGQHQLKYLVKVSCCHTLQACSRQACLEAVSVVHAHSRQSVSCHKH